MSVLAVSDLVFNDLLTQLDIKPWWEDLRGYCFAVTVVSSLFMMYISLSSTTINCIPLVAENVTTCTTTSAAQANFANNYCFNQLPWYVSILGFVPICLSIFILIASSYWTLSPDVMNSFRTFAQFEQIITKLNLTSDQLCKMSSEIVNTTSSKEIIQVRKACSLLWTYRSPICVERYYYIRNWILLLVTFIILGFSGTILHFLFRDNGNFDCDLDFTNQGKHPHNVAKEQLCSYNQTVALKALMFIFAVSLTAQCVFTAVGIFKFLPDIKMPRKRKNIFEQKLTDEMKSVLTDDAQSAARYSFFVLEFWKNSKPSCCGALEYLVYHIFYGTIVQMQINLKRAIKDDVEMLKLYCSLKRNGGKFLCKAIIKEIRKKTFSVDSTQHANIKQCIGFLQNTDASDVQNLYKGLIDYKLWEVLANLIILTIDELSNIYFREDIPFILNTNEIGKPYDLGRSILYYFVSDELVMNEKTQSILKNLEFEVVHFDGYSYTVQEYLERSHQLKINSNATEKECEIFKSDDLSQQAIKHICKNHRKITLQFEKRSRNSDYKIYLENLAKQISRYKFKVWDDNIRSLAEFAMEKEQWVLFVALLYAYFDPHNGTTEYQDSYTSLFSEVNQNTLESILYYVLRKPLYLEHIPMATAYHFLRYSPKGELNVRKPDGTILSAYEYVEKNKELSLDEKDRLINLLEEIYGSQEYRGIFFPPDEENHDVGSSNISPSAPANSQMNDEEIVVEPPNDENHGAESGNISAPKPALLQKKIDVAIDMEPLNDEKRDRDSGYIASSAPAFLQMNDEESSDDENKHLIRHQTPSIKN